ncbi:LapA family protein [Dysosmobacter sp.]|uniref:LapA family protein n=1 Tax=Dysosmobacter sp. TaxID=2591382 RepID=UPI002A8471DF|nr:LapA family protein [Dysosmobacter sp.]MDY3282208.1 LapA family protein [Dysosmobacter sp.]
MVEREIGMEGSFCVYHSLRSGFFYRAACDFICAANCRGKLRHLPLFLLELFPLSGALYYAVQRPSVPYLGWKFGVAMCLWIAGAFLFGAGLAWVVYAIKKRG